MESKFNKKFAEQYIAKLLKKHKIEVYGRSVTSCGRAYKKARKIKIPSPTNIDRFAVCLHEIFHVIGRKGSKSFEKEFYCDKYALDTLIKLGYDTTKWIQRMKWHSLSRIAMAHNRGLGHEKINGEIRQFFADVDFESWKGKKVFVGRDYYDTGDPGKIQMAKNLSFDEVNTKLKEQGLTVQRSQSDDSNYGMLVVGEPVKEFGISGVNPKGWFNNLSEVISNYNL